MTIQILELEDKEAADRAARAETERDAAWHEVAMAQLETEIAGSARAQVELKLSRVQSALTTLEGSWLKEEFELYSVQ